MNSTQWFEDTTSHITAGYHEAAVDDHGTVHHMERRGAPTGGHDNHHTVGYDDHHGAVNYHGTTVDPYHHSNYTSDEHENGTHHGDDHHGDDHHGDGEHHGGGHHGCFPSPTPHPNAALFSIMLTLGTCLLAFFLRYFRTSQSLGRTVSI